MAKKITVNEKLLDKVQRVLSMKLCLSNTVQDFQEMYSRDPKLKIFEDRPEHWGELENQLCEYTQRMQSEIMKDLKNLLVEGNAR